MFPTPPFFLSLLPFPSPSLAATEQQAGMCGRDIMFRSARAFDVRRNKNRPSRPGGGERVERGNNPPFQRPDTRGDPTTPFINESFVGRISTDRYGPPVRPSISFTSLCSDFQRRLAYCNGPLVLRQALRPAIHQAGGYKCSDRP
ncbi:hypothetical protein GE09DRAFT_655929 [Coniochaeta sp. 2T2.1]|nr:hypothetical protein GE09DRAFT_655929 [Coniochaeta sp. 2T2.1]